MSNVQTLSINDGSATPVAVDFKPLDEENGFILFADQREDVSEFWPILKVKFERASNARATHRAEIQFHYPLKRTVDSVDVAVDTARFVNGRFIIPNTMTSAEQAHFHAFVSNALDEPLIAAYVVDLEPMF